MTDSCTQQASAPSDEPEKVDFDHSTKILGTRIRCDPNNHELFYERAYCHYQVGNYQASLDDATEAIKRNPSNFHYHYQRGLALIGLSMFADAVTNIKKAIELRARQDDSKLSDIFRLLRDAMVLIKEVKEKARGETNTTGGSAQVEPVTATPPVTSNHQKTNVAVVNNEPVDSTTDKPSPRLNIATNHPNNFTPPTKGLQHTIDTNGNSNNTGSSSNSSSRSNLVASTNRNINQKQCANQIFNANTAKVNAVATPHTVTSSAGQINSPGQQTFDYSPNISIHQSLVLDNSKTSDHHHVVMSNNQHNQTIDESTRQQQQQPPLAASPYEWNIRRSERIFLHNSSEPGTSGPHDDVASNHRFKIGSNPSSVSSGKGLNKRLHEQTLDSKSYQNDAASNNKQMLGSNSFVESEIDVDDSGSNVANLHHRNLDAKASHKRVIVTPSSSMPATSQSPATTSNKEDSYSSKYKRLRRDRERARRGTSKLCTIKPSDLDELHKLSKTGSDKKYMRVIAPIDGWLYSGQLSADDNHQQGSDSGPHYVVKLDGDTSASSYLFTQETVLNDVIKEVRVKSVSELRKGARICCYWSRQYKCLSTGVVTSRTFEETKSLVSVKYDNGDLSALPLEDLRLLPPDYPKYMSNCDPLLLARNGDNMDPDVAANITTPSSRIVVDCKSSNYSSHCVTYSKSTRSDAVAQNEKQSEKTDCQLDTSVENNTTTTTTTTTTNNNNNNNNAQGRSLNESNHGGDHDGSLRSALENETIPPTSETIDFITSEANSDTLEEQIEEANVSQPVAATKESDLLANESQIENSRASSEENNRGIEYIPWVFEGPPKRSKRNGRTYRHAYSAIRRGNEVLSVGDSAELMPRDESILPFIAKIDGLWATSRGEMKVLVRWYYRLIETAGGEHLELEDGENALFETNHLDENDVECIWRTAKILSWTDYYKNHVGHVNKPSDGPKIFYLAGYYDPLKRQIKHLESDVKGMR